MSLARTCPHLVLDVATFLFPVPGLMHVENKTPIHGRQEKSTHRPVTRTSPSLPVCFWVLLYFQGDQGGPGGGEIPHVHSADRLYQHQQTAGGEGDHMTLDSVIHTDTYHLPWALYYIVGDPCAQILLLLDIYPSKAPSPQKP